LAAQPKALKRKKQLRANHYSLYLNLKRLSKDGRFLTKPEPLTNSGHTNLPSP